MLCLAPSVDSLHPPSSLPPFPPLRDRNVLNSMKILADQAVKMGLEEQVECKEQFNMVRGSQIGDCKHLHSTAQHSALCTLTTHTGKKSSRVLHSATHTIDKTDCSIQYYALLHSAAHYSSFSHISSLTSCHPPPLSRHTQHNRHRDRGRSEDSVAG